MYIAKYNWVDSTKIGLSPSVIPNPSAPIWVGGTVYGANSIVANGGFLFSTVAGGTAGATTLIGPTPQNLTDNTITWVLIGPITGLGVSDATAQVELGFSAIAKDPTYGIAEFVYVKFSGTTVAGDIVFVNRQALTAAQCPTSAAVGILGVSMGSQTTGKFGWVMVRGIMDAANVVTSATVGLAGGTTAAAGRANATGTVSNYSFDGMFIRVTGVSSVGCVELLYPSCSGALI